MKPAMTEVHNLLALAETHAEHAIQAYRTTPS